MKIRREMDNLDRSADGWKDKLNILENRYNTIAERLGDLASAAANAGYYLGEEFKKQLHEADKEVMNYINQLFKLQQELTALNEEEKSGKDNTLAISAKQAEIENVSLKFMEAAKKQKKLIDDAKEAGATFEAEYGIAAQAVETVSEKFDSMMKKLVGVAALKSFFGQVLQVRQQFQDMESEMTTFLGNAEKGASFFAELKDYAFYNMFGFDEINKAANALLSYKTEAKDVIPIIDQLSNIASGTGAHLIQFVEMYNKAKATGALDGRDIQSWARAGVNLKQVLSDMGERVSGNAVTFKQLKMAINAVTSEGGQFAGLMNEKMSNLSSSIGQLKDNWNNMLNEIGQSHEGAFKSAIDLASKLIDNYQKFLPWLNALIAAYGSYKIATSAAMVIDNIRNAQLRQNIFNIIAEKLALDKATASQIKFNAAAKANPYILAASVLIGVVTAIASFVSAKNRATDAEKANTAAMNENITKLETEYDEMKQLFDVYQDETKAMDERRDAMKQLNDKYGDYLENMLTEKSTAEEVAAAHAKIRDELKKESSAQYAATIGLDKKMGTAQQQVYGIIAGLNTKGNESYYAKAEYDARKMITDFISSSEEDLESFTKTFNSLYSRGTTSNANTPTRILQKRQQDAYEETLEALRAYREAYQQKKRYDSALDDIYKQTGGAKGGEDTSMRAFGTWTDEKGEKQYGLFEQIRQNDAKIKAMRAKSVWQKETNDYEGTKKEIEALEKQNKALMADFKTRTGYDYQTIEQEQKTSRDWSEKVRKDRVEQMRKQQDDEFKVREEGIKKRSKSVEKDLEQLKLEHDKEMVQIERNYEDLRDKKIAHDKEMFESSPERKKDNKVYTYNYSSSKFDPTKAEQEAYNNAKESAENAYKLKVLEIIAKDTALNDYLIEYGNYWEKREALADKYTKQIAATEVDAEKKSLDEQKRLALKKLDEDIGGYNSILDSAKDYAHQKAKIERDANSQLDELTIKHNKLEMDLLGDLTDKQRESLQKEIELNEDAQRIIIANRNDALLDLETKSGQKLALVFGNISEYTKGQIEEARKAVDEYLANTPNLSAEKLKVIYDQRNALDEAERNLPFRTGDSDWRNLLINGDYLARKDAERTAVLEKLDNAKLELQIEESMAVKDNEKIARLKNEIKYYEGEADALNLLIPQLMKKEELDKQAVTLNLTAQGLNVISNSMIKLGEAMNNDGLKGAGEVIGDLSSVFGSMLNSLMKGDLLGAAVSGLTTLVSGLFNAFVEGAAATEKYNDSLYSLHETMRRLAFDDQMKEGLDSIFGADRSQQMRNYISVLDSVRDHQAQMLNEFKNTTDIKLVDDLFGPEAISSLEQFKITTKKTKGFLGIGKTIQKESLAELAGKTGFDLYDKNGNLNAAFLKELLSTYGDLSKEEKKFIEQAIADSEAYEEAINGIKDNLRDVFGDMSSQLTELTINSLKSGAEIGSYEMKRVLSGSISDLQKQLVQGIYNKALAQYEERILNGITNEGWNEERIVSEYANMIDKIAETVKVATGAAQRFDDVARENGFELDELENETGSRGSYQNISETTGSAIEGRLAGLQISSANKEAMMSNIGFNMTEMMRMQLEGITIEKDIRDIHADALLALTKIRENTSGNLAQVTEIKDLVTNIELKTRNL